MDELIDALMNLIKVKADRDKAFADCDQSWGYYGSGREEELQNAQTRFGNALKRFIQSEMTVFSDDD